MRLAAIYILGLLALSSCKSKKDLAADDTVPLPKPKPAWITERPSSGAFYIGVGSSSKTREPIDFQQVAKKNALADLSSEIRVVVQGETFLNTLEQNYQFNEEFRSAIRTTVLEEIESYEMIDSWQDAQNYWVYYRLSKAEHARIKQEKKNNALNLASDLYNKAEIAQNSSNFPEAFDMYLRSLVSLEAYWGEKNEYLSESGNILLDIEAYSKLKALCRSANLRTESDQVILNKSNGFINQFPVYLEMNGKALAGVPLQYHYDKDKFFRTKSIITDVNGSVLIPVSEISLKSREVRLKVSVPVEELVSADLDKKIVLPIIESLRSASREFPVIIELPKMMVDSRELVFNNNATGKVLADALSSSLSTNGFRVAGTKNEADYIIAIESNTTQGGTSQGFHVAFLDMNISVKDARNNEEVFRRSYNQLKGLQLNFDSASAEAYKKGVEKIKEEVSKALIEQLL